MRILLPLLLVLLTAALPLQKRTFANDVAPAIGRSCTPCHRDGGPAPFKLESYEDVRRRAKQISEDIGSYHMPPCNAISDFGRFCTYDPMTDLEYVSFLEWTNQGFTRGRALLPQVKSKVGWWGRPDMVLHIGGGSLVRADASPYWRTFRVSLPRGIAIRGFEVRATSPAVVRHVLVAKSSGVRTRLDKAAGGPSMMGVAPTSLIGSWAPGYPITLLPADKGIEVAALDVEVQYQPSGRLERAGFELAIFSGKKKARAPEWKTMGQSGFVIPADTVVTLTDVWTVPADMDLYAIEPEFGYFRALYKLQLKTPDGRAENLLSMEHWNPYWQGNYRFSKPVPLPKGSTLTATAEYRNTLRDSHDFIDVPPQPKTLHSGQGPVDERFQLHLQVAGKLPQK